MLQLGKPGAKTDQNNSKFISILDSSLVIAQANIDNLDALSELCKQTILETYASQSSKENLELFISSAFNTKQVQEELEDPLSTFFIASHGNEVIAYAKLKDDVDDPENEDGKGILLERLFVIKKYQKKMVGAFMLNHLINISKSRDFGYIWLGVWEFNSRAIKFFTNWQFKSYKSKNFYLGNERMKNTLMKRML